MGEGDGDGDGDGRLYPSLVPSSRMGLQPHKRRGASDRGKRAQSLPTRLPSRRVLKSKRILPGEMKFPLFLINP